MLVYDSFGLPPFETMACSTPVIISNISSIPDVVGDAVFMVLIGNVDKMKSYIEEICENDLAHLELCMADIEQAGKFSWTESARLTFDALFASKGK
jgi:glycosyltransferase involved in cell wall biosynthesis